MRSTFRSYHGHHVYLAKEHLLADGCLCDEGKEWLEAQSDTEWHLIDGTREWPAAPLAQIAWFADAVLASKFKLLYG